MEDSKWANDKIVEGDERSFEDNNASIRRLVGKEGDGSIDGLAAQVDAFESGNPIDQLEELQNSDSKKDLKKAVKSAYSRKAKKRF